MEPPPRPTRDEPAGEPAGLDPRTFDELLEQYLPSVRAYLRLRAGRLLLDKESVSDLAQSVCRVVLENAGRFRHAEEDGFRRWLFKTAERKVLDRYAYYTAQKRSPEAESGRDGELEGQAAHDRSARTPSCEAVAREDLARLELAIEQLPTEMQEVVILAKVVGLSRAAIAAELGKSEGAVRMQLHRALAQLSDNMARAERAD